MRKANPTRPQSRSSRFRRYLEIRPSIEGWFSQEAASIWWTLLNHQTEIGIAGDLLEIGVWRGKAALELAIHAQAEFSERCILVDKYVQLPDLQYEFARLGMLVDDYATIVECDARELSRMRNVVEPPGRYRWIHIDEEHSAEAIAEELDRAKRLLCGGGIACINAYMSTTHPQVTGAILRYVEERPDGLRMFLGGFDKAYFTTPSHFRHYMDFCYDELVYELELLDVHTTLTKKTRADSLNFFGICDRHRDRRFLGPDGDDQSVDY